MRKISRSIDIEASVDRVYDFLTRPENLPGIWPSMIDVTNIERRDDGWQAFDWTYKMAGFRFHGKAKTVRVEKNAYVEIENATGITSIFRWRYQPQGTQNTRTKLTVDVDYTVPPSVLGKIAEAIVAKLNEHEMDTMLKNLKLLLETAPQVRPSDGARAHP